MSNKTYVILGGNGIFGVHTAMYLLQHANPNPHPQKKRERENKQNRKI